MENVAGKNLVDTLLDLVHENGYIAVKEAMETSVLERANVSDPFVFMTNLLKKFSLDSVVDNELIKFSSKIIDSGSDGEDVFKIVQINDFFYKITGYESSYLETTWTKWAVVTPKQKTITIYE